MNNRIKQLAEQSTIYVTGFPILDEQKFAELIVKECARVYWNIDDGETHTEYVEALKQHFGVEE